MIEPFYFGREPKLLFGIYYPPYVGHNVETGIILCYPMGQEYMRSHRAFLHLARTLSSDGFNVLKFDYYGCGDSAGKCEEGDIQQWISDISKAVDELKEGCEAKRLYLVGLRLGATLALISSDGRDDIDGVVLWDPIVKGANYIDELRIMHQEWLRGSFSRSISQQNREDEEEILGFPLTDTLKSQLGTIDLTRGAYGLSIDTLLIESSISKDTGCFRQYLNQQNAVYEYVNISSPAVWVKGDDESKGIVPPKIIQYIKEWLIDKRKAC